MHTHHDEDEDEQHNVNDIENLVPHFSKENSCVCCHEYRYTSNYTFDLIRFTYGRQIICFGVGGDIDDHVEKG
jgi:hypothetical protein